MAVYFHHHHLKVYFVCGIVFVFMLSYCGSFDFLMFSKLKDSTSNFPLSFVLPA